MVRTLQNGFAMIPLLAAVGCQQGPPKAMDMAEMMKQPPRPAELDRLEALVGSWEATGSCTMAGAPNPVTTKGSNTIEWDCDKRVLVEHWEGEMGGDRMHGLAIWTWDPESKKYRVWWFDNFGGTTEGVAAWNESTRSFTMNSESEGPLGETVGKGTMKMVDGNTVDFHWEEWNSWKTQKMMDMRGTSKRKAAAGG